MGTGPGTVEADLTDAVAAQRAVAEAALSSGQVVNVASGLAVAPVPYAAAAAVIVTAIETRRRTMASSPVTHLQLLAARLFPRVAERVIARRLRRVQGARPAPALVQYPEAVA